MDFKNFPVIKAIDNTLVAWKFVESIKLDPETEEDTFDRLSGGTGHVIIRTVGGESYRVTVAEMMIREKRDPDQDEVNAFLRNLPYYWGKFVQEKS